MKLATADLSDHTTLPVLGISGYSGSGKTTLLEQLIPELRGRGLRIGVIKHDAHGVDVDRPGKDSDRLFRAGADVVLQGPDQGLRRSHGAGELWRAAAALLEDHDLVLVEGHKTQPIPKLWLCADGETAAPAEIEQVLATLARGEGRRVEALAFIDAWLPAAWRAAPVYGGVLLGGQSTRMGQPKQLLQHQGQSFAEIAVRALAPQVDQVLLLGAGAVPPALKDLPRLADAPDLGGPMAGLLAALRWAPGATWVTCACDMPQVRPEAVAWLLEQRAPGRWAVQPRRDGQVEPLLALYDHRALGLIAQLVRSGVRGPHRLAEDSRVFSPELPAPLAGCWRGVNTPDELAELVPRT